jgi:DNA-binding LytR/AlgR family response regulator
MKVRALIVEDELLARETLCDFAARIDWLEVIGEATNGEMAVRMIDSLTPELVFLDVQMPIFSGLRVLEIIRHQPFIVFTTAFDDYAVTAFEFGALDYLLKPFGIDRFQKSLNRVKRHLYADKFAVDIPNVTERVTTAFEKKILGESDKFFVRDSRGRAIPIKIENILWLAAADDYVEIHTKEKSYLMNITLNDFERRLDAKVFRRVHRSHIVNLKHVKAIESCDRRLLFRLTDNSEVISSRAMTKTLKETLL